MILNSAVSDDGILGPLSTPPAPAASSSATMTADDLDAALTKLADLRERGLISEAEFEAKREDLLDRL